MNQVTDASVLDAVSRGAKTILHIATEISGSPAQDKDDLQLVRREYNRHHLYSTTISNIGLNMTVPTHLLRGGHSQAKERHINVEVELYNPLTIHRIRLAGGCSAKNAKYADFDGGAHARSGQLVLYCVASCR